ncbi:MAG: DUF58 domain-containing protein [Polyangiales bacterium]
MLDRAWIYAALALNVTAIANGNELLALCSVLALLLSLWAYVMRRFGLSGVLYQRRLGATQAEFGDTIELTVELTNRKLLPLAALAVEDPLPRFLPVEGGVVRPGLLELPELCIVRAMRPYERVRRQLRVRCMRRGRHRFGPARWEATDYLGTRSLHRTGDDVHSLLVLPKTLPLTLAGAVARQLLGDGRAPRALFDDPLRVVGTRVYQPGDPPRSIDWRASARRDALMVRRCEPSATPSLELALDFHVAMPRGDRVEPDELEHAISVAASLARHAATHRWRFGLSANGLAEGARVALPASSAPAQLRLLLELLARAGSRPDGRLADLLRARGAQAGAHGMLVVITQALDDALRAVLLDLHRRGRSVAVVLTADGPPQPSPFPVLRAAYDTTWSERDRLVVT